MCLIPIKSHALGKKDSVDFMNGACLPMEHNAIPMDVSGLYWGQWVAQGEGQGICIHLRANLDHI